MFVKTLDVYDVYDEFDGAFSLEACEWFEELNEWTGEEFTEFDSVAYECEFEECDLLDYAWDYMEREDYVVLNPWYHLDHYDYDAIIEHAEHNTLCTMTDKTTIVYQRY